MILVRDIPKIKGRQIFSIGRAIRAVSARIVGFTGSGGEK
jgi:hypothetical protein